MAKPHAKTELLPSYISTNDFAYLLGVQGQTIRRGLCMNGHYMGVKPIKLLNRRLLWPIKDIQKILGTS